MTSKHVLHASRVISPAARSKQEGLLRDLTMLRPEKRYLERRGVVGSARVPSLEDAVDATAERRDFCGESTALARPTTPPQPGQAD